MDFSCNDVFYISSFRYFLQPRENGGKSVKVEELGSLRLNIVYTEDHVFPSEHYTPLRDLLLYSANVEVRQVHLKSFLFLSCLDAYTPLFLCFSLCRRPRPTSWGRCVGRSKKPPFPSCVSSFTTGRSCLSSAPSLTLKSTAHSEFLQLYLCVSSSNIRTYLRHKLDGCGLFGMWMQFSC